MEWRDSERKIPTFTLMFSMSMMVNANWQDILYSLQGIGNRKMISQLQHIFSTPNPHYVGSNHLIHNHILLQMRFEIGKNNILNK